MKHTMANSTLVGQLPLFYLNLPSIHPNLPISPSKKLSSSWRMEQNGSCCAIISVLHPES